MTQIWITLIMLLILQYLIASWSGIIGTSGAAAVVKSEITELKRMRSIFFTVSLAAIAICLVLIIYFILVHYRPLKKIIHGFEQDMDPSPNMGNEYERLEVYSSRIMSASKINRSQLLQFEKGMDNQYYEKLLKGFIAYRHLPEHLKNIDLQSASEVFFLAFIKISGSDFPSEVIHLYATELISALPANWTPRRYRYPLCINRRNTQPL